MKIDIPKVDIPTGKSGIWQIGKFSVNETEAVMFNLRSMRGGMRNRAIVPGEYTRLSCGGEVVMSDTPAEMRDHEPFVHECHGDILITGLGLGMVANACLLKDGIGTVTVIEKSADVIALAADHYRQKFGERFQVIHADALKWKPGKGQRWGAVWHDIWPTICADNLPQMTTLKRRFARRVTGAHGCWCEIECHRAKRGYYH